MKVLRKAEPNIYYKAESFHIAAQVLNQANEMQYRGSPFIVNATFAIELYLKCFDGQTVFNQPSEYCEGVTKYENVTSEGSNRGHDLGKLFNHLNDANRKQISSAFEKRISGITSEEFFEKYRDHFVSWRYGFEGNATVYSPSEILVMLEVLKESASQYI
ncbi:MULTISPECIES: hypothetical protein [unclassified Pseudoalteromonas]|uniref:hypothetical protein n=1 Tax=unclassified Pseudoalteromonas TaxID=194690 RepID=UPI0015FAB8A3|nr:MULTISPECIES: hypothetical protein [unclassified Pseudoalteromonas]MBB1278997.1 hypothetical protein [Pseudoalteromonas sp. SR41-1]MBB1349361.1 hypothetical protein [Pseudoalteromonas sp. SG45-3]MBB1352520.1 hypothetical protein [Pseudoalteromonas sp. SR45-5]MBB1356785.1 hypothetical protein [Pseudoalteromonas sp. SG45-6]